MSLGTLLVLLAIVLAIVSIFVAAEFPLLAVAVAVGFAGVLIEGRP
jgi:hypothetical protein